MMVGVTVVGTRLGELEWGSCPCYLLRMGNMTQSEEVDKWPEEHKQPEEQGPAKKK